MPQIIIRSVPWSPCTKNAAKEGGQRESLQNKFTKVVQSQPDWCNLNQNKFIKLDEKIQQKSYRYHSATIQLIAQNKGIIFSTASVCIDLSRILLVRVLLHAMLSYLFGLTQV